MIGRGKRLALALLAAAGLGCSGIAERVLDLDTDIQQGAAAVHPADFPLPPPPSGKLVSSMKADVMTLHTFTVIYEIDETDPSALLEPYEKLMKEAGLRVQRQDDGKTVTVAGTGDSMEVWTAALSREQTPHTLALVVASSR